jgi:Tol biopolymer transport system component
MCRCSSLATRHAIFCAAIVLGIGSSLAAEPAKGLYLANADGELRLVMPWEEGTVITSPQQSPDGKWIAFDKCGVFNEAGQPDPQFGRIWVVPSEGGPAKDLGPGMLPSWSPDSKQICFSVGQGAPDGKPGMYVMNADGTGREWLFEALAGRWSPDGSRIAFFKNGDVHVYDTLTNESIQLSNSPQNVTGTPAWSADGTQIAYVHFSNADHSLSIVDSTKEMQQPRVLWEGHGIARTPSWAPNKQILVFASPDKVNDIYVLDPLMRTKPERPFEGKFTFRPKDPAWAADGKSIVFIKPK